MDKVGRYWDNKTEIDGVGFHEKSKKIVFMEAKWSGSKQNLRELKKLQTKAKEVKWNINEREEFFVIYSKSGFTKDLLEYAKENKSVFLVKELDFIRN